MAYADKIRRRYLKASSNSPLSRRRNLRTTSDGHAPINPLGQAQYGKLVDSDSGKVGGYAVADDVADRELAEAINDQAKTSTSRWYTVRVIFAWGKFDGKYTKVKKAGVYLLSPVGLTSEQSEQLIKLPGDEYAEALDDIRKRVETVRGELQFVLEHDGPYPFRLPMINRHRLVDEVVKMWASHPVATNGNIELRWPDGRVKVLSTREQLLSTEGQTQLFEHVSRILDLMDRGYRYDPKVHSGTDLAHGSLRRFQPDEKWPGAVYRGGPLNED